MLLAVAPEDTMALLLATAATAVPPAWDPEEAEASVEEVVAGAVGADSPARF
jgi:hypothetical protein